MKLSMDTKAISWSDVVKKNLVSPSSPINQVIKTTVNFVAKENDRNKVLIISNIPEVGDSEDDRNLLLEFIKGLKITDYQPDIRNIVRLGRIDEEKNPNRLIKVTFVKIIMAAHRSCVSVNWTWKLSDSESVAIAQFTERIPDFPKNIPYRKMRVRPDLPGEIRDKLKVKAQKVYQMNNELRTKADIVGVPVSVSFSLRQNGSIARFEKKTEVIDGEETEKWINTGFKDVKWTDDSNDR